MREPKLNLLPQCPYREPRAQVFGGLAPAKKILSTLGVVTILSIAPLPAGAITAELAKKCRALAVKAHPPPPHGAGTGGAYAAAERDYFTTCVAKNGNMPEVQPEQKSPR